MQLNPSDDGVLLGWMLDAKAAETGMLLDKIEKLADA